MAMISSRPQPYPTPSATIAAAMTDQPSGVTTPCTARAARLIAAAAVRAPDEPTLDDDREQAALPGLLGNARVGLGEGHTACLVEGGGVSMSTCAIMFDAVTPSNSASGSRIRRCASTGSASALMSSGTT